MIIRGTKFGDLVIELNEDLNALPPGKHVVHIRKVLVGTDTEKEISVKLIKKADVQFVDGHLIDKDGNVINQRRLVSEVNELAELKSLVEFVIDNAGKIKASTEKVTFSMPKHEVPSLKSEKVVATPLMDEDKAAKEARALEFLDAQNVNDINGHLARYQELARFFASDHIEVTDGGLTTEKFLVDPLAMSEAEVVSLIEKYREPEVFKLTKLVSIDFS